eukprot:TRINITY_DN1881_c0_g2_i3.p2 TRINITY_DN1881_c0_g2~~TRINITY_DN1881_c0_g2_i3.p2  ORF type:complete len:149 (+),score=18.81 TRINITY_DN1881_c0_g2_i3:132-578(+)
MVLPPRQGVVCCVWWSIVVVLLLASSPITPTNAVKVYGKWCGPQHGGYQNCCNGTACAACVWQTTKPSIADPTPECLAACPPIDAIDAACAAHDLCTFRHDLATVINAHTHNTTNNTKKHHWHVAPGFSCNDEDLIGGNYCPCDCALP